MTDRDSASPLVLNCNDTEIIFPRDGREGLEDTRTRFTFCRELQNDLTLLQLLLSGQD